MAEPRPAAQVAKELGIYLGQIYPLVQKGLVKNHKPDGKYNVDGGKGLEVDIDEVRAAMSSSRKRGGKGSRGPKAGSKAHARVDPEAAKAARAAKAAGKKDLSVGTMISFHKGASVLEDDGFRARVIDKGWTIYAITGRYRQHIAYAVHNGVPTKNTMFFNDMFRNALARGSAKVERPEAVLGMIMFQWIATDHLDLAASLEEWCEANGLTVNIPEPVFIEDDEPEGPAEDVTSDEDEDD